MKATSLEPTRKDGKQMKNEEKLLYTLGEVDPKYVPSDNKRKHPAIKWAAIGTAAVTAAAAGFAAISGALYPPVKSILPLDGEGIDIVETSTDTTVTEASGEASATETAVPETETLPKIPYRGFCWNSDYEESSLVSIGYNIKDYGYRLIDANPWREEQGITSLPVYENLSYGGDYEYPDFYLGEETMKEMAEKAAEALGLTIPEFETGNFEYDIYQNYLEEEGTGAEDDGFYEYRQDDWYVKAVCDGADYGVKKVSITVCSRGDMLVHFQNYEPDSMDPHYLQLPEEYSDDEEAMSDYLKERFKKLLDFDNPSDDITFETYNVTDDPVQNILNYSFENVHFVMRRGELVTIDMDKKFSVAKLVGEYEIITPEEAKEKLLASSENFRVRDGLDLPEPYGLGLTEPRVMPTEENIVGINIVYPDREMGLEDLEYFKPYYCIYVNSDCYEDKTTYDLYYIPALTDEYIA